MVAGAGVGSALTYASGSLYLAGPYNGAPLSVASIVPAVAGPFDVGTIVTRFALRLNPNTAEVEVDGAASDPIPHILKGIPLVVRDLRAYVERPEFMLNPTSCEKKATTAQIFGSGADVFSPADDVSVTVSSPFQAASCASLAFKPKVALQLKGGTKRGDHPALKATVTYPYPSGPGYANIGEAAITLPRTEFIDNAHINNPCTRVKFNENACPPKSVLGNAKAITPLLDAALRRPGLLPLQRRRTAAPRRRRRPSRRRLSLHRGDRGQGQERTPQVAHPQCPDAPVTSFTLSLKGGKEGLLVNSDDLCRQKRYAKVELTGQNGRIHNTEPVVKTSCKGKGKGKGGKRAGRRAR